MSLWQVNADDVLVLDLLEPLLGLWTCTAQIDSDVAPAIGSAVVLKHTAEDGTGTEWRGSVLESMPHLGRSELYCVGGSGGLRQPLPARHYRTVTPRIVAEDILREAGEAGPPAADLSWLDSRPVLKSWTRTAPKGKCTGSVAMTALCRAVGAGWRMRRDGTVVVAAESWPAHQGGDPWVEKVEGGKGSATAAPDRPDLLVGTVLDGKRVQSVHHGLDINDHGGAYRMKIVFQDATAVATEGRDRDFFRRAVQSTLPRLELCRWVWATVQSQGDDGLLDVTPDDTTIPELTGVQILHGLPGISIEVSQGARVLIGCIGGWRHEADETAAPDEVEHFAALWATDAAFLTITIDGGTQSIARVGDSVHAGWLLGVASPGGGPITWQYFPADTTPPPLPAPGLIELSGGRITSGFDKVKS